jgi:hypothetical protein
MELDEEVYRRVYDAALENEWHWKLDGVKRLPAYEDIVILLDRMVEQVRKSPSSISIESGGILVKRTDDYVDVYVFAGGVQA